MYTKTYVGEIFTFLGAIIHLCEEKPQMFSASLKKN